MAQTAIFEHILADEHLRYPQPTHPPRASNLKTEEKWYRPLLRNNAGIEK